jgi:hypothetical protein
LVPVPVPIFKYWYGINNLKSKEISICLTLVQIRIILHFCDAVRSTGKQSKSKRSSGKAQQIMRLRKNNLKLVFFHCDK